VNYAAKSKDLWGIPCPVFVRSIGMEGGIGATATGSHHSIYTRMPGIPVCAPMTPKEYESIWKYYMDHDDPLLVSEHRRSFPIDYEMPDVIHDDADITLFPISATRLNAIEAAKILEKESIKCNIVHLLWLKPFVVEDRMHKALANSKHGGLVIDGDFENGVVKSLGFDLVQKTGKKVHVLGLEDRSAGIAPQLDNVAPTAEKISAYVRTIVRSGSRT
jgi:pyruvate/2-oxoglutarate/acetoin dehydrogenase E1 component